jgi:hypothetical protein
VFKYDQTIITVTKTIKKTLMISRPLSRVIKYSLLIVSSGILFSCSAPAGKSRPERKKMFNLNTRVSAGECTFASAGDGVQEAPFTMHDVTMSANGIRSTYLSLALPDATYDSAAIAMALTCKPFAVPLLSQWANQEKKGVLFDLRNNNNKAELRTDYIVQTPGMFSIPVIFLYDRLSAGRMAGFVNVIQSVPALQCKLVASGLHDMNNF